MCYVLHVAELSDPSNLYMHTLNSHQLEKNCPEARMFHCFAKGLNLCLKCLVHEPYCSVPLD